jgi:hypothetical protein
MSNVKIKVEIYEGDPFSGCCGPSIASSSSAEKLRAMLVERNKTVEALKEEFNEKIEVEREIVSSRKRYDVYPQHILKLLRADTKMPFIVINGQLVSEGIFPSYEDFRQLVVEHTKD